MFAFFTSSGRKRFEDWADRFIIKDHSTQAVEYHLLEQMVARMENHQPYVYFLDKRYTTTNNFERIEFDKKDVEFDCGWSE